MNITVNGIPEITSSKTISEYLISKNIPFESFKGIIVEHNFNIVKTHKWDSTFINDGDNIEILKLTGGG